MCGRTYSTYTDDELRFQYLNKKGIRWPINSEIPEFRPNYNMCPTQKALVLGVFDGTLGFKGMRWGLVPAWAESVKAADKYSMINAKAEEVSEKRSYKNAFKKRRCIVPVSGFIEWRGPKGSKVPYAIQLKDQPIMSMGGIWESWEDKESKEIVDSFSILTMAANSFMQGIHTHMPFVLTKEMEEAWIAPDAVEPEVLLPLVKPIDSSKLEAFEISDLVNKPQNNSPEVLVHKGAYQPPAV